MTFCGFGTRGVTGVYSPTCGAISHMINKNSKEYGIKSTMKSNAESVYNINAVLSVAREFGVAKSDRQYQAYTGLAEWAEKSPQTELRAVFSIHPESINLIAAAASNVQNVQGMVGKRANIDNHGSGQLQKSKDVLEAPGARLAALKA